MEFGTSLVPQMEQSRASTRTLPSPGMSPSTSTPGQEQQPERQGTQSRAQTGRNLPQPWTGPSTCQNQHLPSARIKPPELKGSPAHAGTRRGAARCCPPSPQHPPRVPPSTLGCPGGGVGGRPQGHSVPGPPHSPAPSGARPVRSLTTAPGISPCLCSGK